MFNLTHSFSEFHRYLMDSYSHDKKYDRQCILAPRGNGKTTLYTTYMSIYKLCYNKEYLLILSQKEDHAKQKLQNIVTEFKENDLLQYFYEIKFSTDSREQAILTIDGNESLLESSSFNSELRGKVWKGRRPSHIICDDIENQDSIYSEEIRKQTKDKFKTQVSELGSPTTNIIVLGTNLHNDSLVNELATKNPSYDSKIFRSVMSWPKNKDIWSKWEKIYTNLTDPHRLAKSDEFFETNKESMTEGFKVLWPDYEGPLYLMKKRIELGDKAFRREKQNEPIALHDQLFTKLHYFTTDHHDFYHTEYFIDNRGNEIPVKDLIPFMAMDPAHSSKKDGSSDFTSRIVGFFQPLDDGTEGRLFIYEDITLRDPPKRQIDSLFALNKKYNFSEIGYEINLFRNMFKDNLDLRYMLLDQQEIQYNKLPITEIESKENKEMRIRELEPKVNAGHIVFNRAGMSSEARDEIEGFPACSHDDYLDCLHMLWRLSTKYYQRQKTVNVHSF